MNLPEPVIARFWRFVRKTETCWLWLGSKDQKGYGYFGLAGKNKKAHRIAWLITHGEIPDGLVIDHLCRVPSCVNPAHIEPVTNRENVLRGISPLANFAKLTHCKYGHPLTGDNVTPRGYGRRCKTCRRRSNSEWQKRRSLRGLAQT